MISVVIPAHNEEKYIGRCLESLCNQTYRGEYEVIVVDNASTDATAEIVKSFENKLPLQLIKEPRKGRGPARRAGFDAARGEIILTTDADCIVPKNWIEIMTSGFSNETIVGVTGTWYITDQSFISNTVFNIIQPSIILLFRLAYRTYQVCGVNGGIRKSAYKKTGGFNAKLNTYEDTRFSIVLKKYGKIIYVRKSRVETSGRRFSRSMTLGLLEYIRPFLQVHILHKENAHLRDAR